MPTQKCLSGSVFVVNALFTCLVLTTLVLIRVFVIEESAELVIHNAIVWAGPAHYVTALAIKGNKIMKAGNYADMKKHISPDTVMIDGNQGSVVPGFIESHIHVLNGGFSLMSVQLGNANTIEKFVSNIAEFAKEHPDEWITGGNWDHTLWSVDVEILPERQWIDNVTRQNPVFVNRLDGHMGLANSLALERAGINASTPDVEGGTIVRDKDGNPTGILKDNAMGLVRRVIPPRSESEKDEALDRALEYLMKNGITSVHHMGSLDDLKVFMRAREQNRLPIRIYAAIELSRWKDLVIHIEDYGRGDEWLHWGNLKGFVDGSLGSQTALMFDPYLNGQNDTDKGLFITSEEDLYNYTLSADKAGLQVSLHAIGDRANYVALSLFQNITKQNPERDRRFRIEHAQHVRFSDIPLFDQSSVIASVQPYHIIDDGRWAESLIGPVRANYTYPFKSFLQSGMTLSFGSDWPVAPATPLQGIYSAVTRATLDNKNPGGWIPSQKIDVESSLRGYSVGSAYAEFSENLKGKLEPGYLADLVILEENIFSEHFTPIDFWDVAVAATIVDGKKIYEKPPPSE
jgi:hypothetical protein